MSRMLVALSIASIVFCGAIFGFFYAWVCSTMWGLDQADPRVAIAAMQAVNASVRNAIWPLMSISPSLERRQAASPK
ncbi:putative membrane protein [Bradyrhizobium sp. AZCC 1578]